MRQSKDVSFIHIIDYVRSLDEYLNLYVCARIVKDIDVDRKKNPRKEEREKNRRAATMYHALRCRFVIFYFHFFVHFHISLSRVFFPLSLSLSPLLTLYMSRFIKQKERIFFFFFYQRC
jgi:hypothetical protein